MTSHYAYRRDVLGYNKIERRKLIAAGFDPRIVSRYQKAKADLRNQKSREARLRQYADFLDEFSDILDYLDGPQLFTGNR